jgi:hypothetical protein
MWVRMRVWIRMGMELWMSILDLRLMEKPVVIVLKQLLRIAE